MSADTQNNQKERKGITMDQNPLPAAAPVKVFGSHIWPEMRVVCNIFDLAKKPYRVESAGDILTESGQKDELAFNPSRAMPVVVINDMKILADPATLIRHICRHFRMEALYPLSQNM